MKNHMGSAMVNNRNNTITQKVNSNSPNEPIITLSMNKRWIYPQYVVIPVC